MTTTPSPTPGAMPIHAKAPTHPGTPEALPLAACHRREHTTTRRRHRDACCNDGEQHPQNNVKRPRPSLRCRRRQSRVRPCRPSILPHISTTSSRAQDHALNDIDAKFCQPDSCHRGEDGEARSRNPLWATHPKQQANTLAQISPYK